LRLTSIVKVSDFDRMNVAYVTHPDCLLHDNGRIDMLPHPESPGRLTAIHDQLIAQGVEPWLIQIEAPLANREDLLLAHAPQLIDEVFSLSPSEGLVMLDGDTRMNPHSLKAALRAAGSGVRAVDWVLEQAGRRAFCAVRPPGHHSGRKRTAGFCIFNNIAIAALHALERWGLERVAIVDFDVHHGDGTEEIVAGDQRILFCSSFQHPYFPYSGSEPLGDNCIPVPLPSGTTGRTWREAVEAAWFERLQAFRPQLILISAGFDGHLLDDMANFGLVEEDYRWITQTLIELSENTAHGRIVSILEGGYEPQALGRSVASHLNALIDG